MINYPACSYTEAIRMASRDGRFTPEERDGLGRLADSIERTSENRGEHFGEGRIFGLKDIAVYVHYATAGVNLGLIDH